MRARISMRMAGRASCWIRRPGTLSGSAVEAVAHMSQPARVALWVGPESGWSEAERTWFDGAAAAGGVAWSGGAPHRDGRTGRGGCLPFRSGGLGVYSEAMMDCIFCKIIAGDIPSERVLRGRRIRRHPRYPPQVGYPCAGHASRTRAFPERRRRAGMTMPRASDCWSSSCGWPTCWVSASPATG